MKLTRRDILKASAAIAAAHGLGMSRAKAWQQLLEGDSAQPVVWLQGQTCSGCSVSLLNSVCYATIDELLLNTIDLDFHPTVMAGAGDLAAAAAEDARQLGGYILVVEGAIPTAAEGKCCKLWQGMTMLSAVQAFASNASWILAVGTCATFGGMSAGSPNPTAAKPVGDPAVVGNSPKLINIPGCPAHPDWIVGTIAYMLSYGRAPQLDNYRRPIMYFGNRIHDYCPERARFCGEDHEADRLGQQGCMEGLGCRGKQTYADCYMRKWNAGQKDSYGVNWCIAAHTPCHGCVEPGFPDGMSPFFRESD